MVEAGSSDRGRRHGLGAGIGLLLGVIAAAVLLTTDHPLGAGPLTGAALAVASLALLSRGLHLDGLADLADGLGSGQPAPIALDIMRRSDIGPFGTVTLILVLLIQVAALSHAETASPGRGAAALITAVVTGRLAMTWACRQGVPAARPDGLGALVAGTVRLAIPVALTLATVTAAAAAVVVSATVTGEPLGWTLPLAVVAGLAAAFVFSGSQCADWAVSPGMFSARYQRSRLLSLWSWRLWARGRYRTEPGPSPPEAVANAPGDDLGRHVDGTLPVQPLEERRV